MKRFSGAVALLIICAGLSLGQSRKDPQNPQTSLIPVVLVNVGVDLVAQPLSTPTGAPLPSPSFLLPRNAAKELDFTTSGGSISVHFFNTAPVSSAFDWVQPIVPVPNAIGRLLYNGCPSCPASFNLAVTASSGTTTVGTTVRLDLTASNGKPQLISVTRNGGTDVLPKYDIKFAPGTFDPADSVAIAIYPNVKTRLILANTANLASGTVSVTIPRLNASRDIQVFLKNPYGSSNMVSVQLPLQQLENGPLRFTCVNCSTEFPDDGDLNSAFSVRHTNSGFLDINGSDVIVIHPLRSGPLPCDQPDSLFHTAVVKWLESDGYSGDSADQGTVSNNSSEPPVDQLLRAPANNIVIAWKLKAFKGDHFYQVMFGKNRCRRDLPGAHHPITHNPRSATSGGADQVQRLGI